MLVNIQDLRERPYRWSSVLAIAESATEDNSAEDSDKVEPSGISQIDYAEKDGVSVREAVQWAERLDGMVSLTLYDVDPESEGE